MSLSNNFKNGKISESYLNSILYKFSPDIPEKIKGILEQFEIIFRLPTFEEEATYVIPSMLNDEPDNFYRTFDRQPENNELFGRIYDFNFVPFGFFARLIARTMSIPSIEILSLWKLGIIAKYQCQSIIAEYDPENYVLIIINQVPKCSGVKCPMNLLNTFIEAIDSLMDVFYVSDKHRLESKIPIYSARDSETGQIPDITLKETISRKYFYFDV